MTFTNARNTSNVRQPATAAPHRQRQALLHQHRAAQREHAYLATRQPHLSAPSRRIDLGSQLNGLDHFLEAGRRRASLVSSMD